MALTKPKILLNVCCATCAAYVIKVLSREFEPVVYFYNPNIQPYEEYFRRRIDVEGYVRSLGFDFIEGEYDSGRWEYMTEGLEHEVEGGLRCNICFKMRLNHVALFAAQNGFEIFTTTLTVSPHKNSAMINRIGSELAKLYDLQFYVADFKKHDGFKISIRMAKELDLYRQNYCGCIPSLRQTKERKRVREESVRQSKQILAPTNVGA